MEKIISVNPRTGLANISESSRSTSLHVWKKKIISHAHGNVEEGNKLLEPSIIIINYCIIIINAYYSQ